MPLYVTFVFLTDKGINDTVNYLISPVEFPLPLRRNPGPGTCPGISTGLI